MPRRTKEEAEQTKQALLMAGLKVFSRLGYAATRLEDVAEEAGVTRGAVYWHFKNKADLYTEIQVQAALRMDRLIGEAVEGATGPLDALKRAMVRAWMVLVEDEEFRATQELTLLKTELTPELLQGMEMKLKGTAQQQKVLIEAIQEATAAGEVDPALDAEAAATAYSAYLNGMAIMYILGECAFPLGEQAEALAEIFMRGIRP